MVSEETFHKFSQQKLRLLTGLQGDLKSGTPPGNYNLFKDALFAVDSD